MLKLFIILFFGFFICFSVDCKHRADDHRPGFMQDDLPIADDTLKQLRIVWNTKVRKISHDVYFAEYGRVRKINGDTIVLVYHFGSKKNEWDNIGIRKSFDNGLTWNTLKVVVPDSRPKRYAGFSTPDLLVLKNRWLLLAYTARGIPDDTLHNNLQIQISKDNGTTWSQSKIVALGRSWEPGMLQLPSGEIQIFFSNEIISNKQAKGRHEQKILMISSTDNGAIWTRPKLVAFIPKVRDGMPVPLLLKNGRGIAFAVEAVEHRQSPQIIWSSLKANWNYSDVASTGNGRRWFGSITPIWGGAPGLLQLDNGATVICMQTEGGRKIDRYKEWKKNTIVVMIGNSTAQNFGQPSWPYPDLPVNQGYYFSSLYLKDKRTIALISTYNYPDGHSELRWKEGRLIAMPDQKANGH